MREELLKLRRRAPAAPRVVPARRAPETVDPDTGPPAA